MSRELIHTNVDWIPTIPKTWKLAKVKNLFYLSKEKAHQDNPIILSLARSGVKIRDISNNEGQLAESYYDYNPVKVGDLLLNPMDLYSGANCNVSEVDGVISPAYSNLRSKIDINSKFYDYYFKTQYWTMAMFAHGKGVSFDNRWTLNNDGLMNYELPFPDYNEQNKIVDELKGKISKIDLLIANQGKQIEKLKEQKQAFISDYVLKNAEYYVPLKKHCLANVDSLKDSNDPNEEIEYVEIGSVSLVDGIKNSELFLFKDAPSRARRKTKIGDIIVSTVRTYLKAIAVVEKNDLIVSTGFAVLSPVNVDSKYLGYALKTDYFTDSVSLESKGISYPAITAEALINIKIPMCSREKQLMITALLNGKCSKIDSLIKIKQQKIEKLQEYKKSLIYEYVTGKKEVA